MTPDVKISRGRRKFLLGGLAAAAATVAYAARPRTALNYLGNAKLQSIVPGKIGKWTLIGDNGLVVAPEDQLEKALYSQLLTRVYDDGVNPPIMLLMAYSAGQTGILQIHRPEVCYPAGGYSLSPIKPKELRLGSRSVPVNSLTATADGVIEQIIYWTRVGDDIPLSWGRQRTSVAEANLKGEIPDALLLRISTRRPNTAQAWVEMAQFASDLVQSVQPANRPILIGR